MGEISSYYSNVNQDLLKAIPPCSKRVLEIGCGTGSLASQFKKINPRAVYWGVEADHEAAGAAKNNPDLDRVIGGDIEEVMHGGSIRNLEAPFDCLVTGDVLEHMKSPEAVIARLSSLVLSEGGSVVACIPNIAHWTAISTLLGGDWPRHDSGIFDRTHLRQFTRSAIVEMFEAAGLSISKIVPRNIVPGGERLIEAVRAFGLVEDPKRFAEESQAYQYVVHAIKGEIPSRKVLVRGFPAEACCARPRLAEPGSFIATIPGFRYAETPTEVQPGESVVVVRQRWNIDEKSVRKHVADGCIVVGEWDDDPWHEGFRPKLKVPVEWALKACHAVSVSTEAIAELVRPINPNVAVFPNQVAAVGPEREDVASGVVRVYMGGQRSRADWEDAVKVVNAIVAENPERYEFVVVHDKELHDALETKRKTFYGFQPYDKYRELLRSCDVALMPLADTRFNRCKSDITEIECGAEGVFFMRYATELDVEPSELSGWTAYARREVIDDERMLCDHYQDRAAWFNKLVDDKAELDRRLFERLPELKEALG